jgi:pyridoxal/pyridoxine/pyridoxamine kinase
MARSRQRYLSSSLRDSDKPAKQLAKHRVRVVLRLEQQKNQVLWLTNDEAYAHSLADYFCQNVLVDSACVQKASWENGRVTWQLVESPDTLEYRRLRYPSISLPGSGDLVLGVLLAEQTKKGGWRVRSWAWGDLVTGIVSNTEAVPLTAKPDDQVRLRVAAVNRELTHVQFRWCDKSEVIPKINLDD